MNSTDMRHIFPNEIYVWEQIQNQCDIAFDVGVNDLSHLCEFREKDNKTLIYLFEPNINYNKMVAKYKSEYTKSFNIGFGDKKEDTFIFNNSQSITRRETCSDSIMYPIKIETLDEFCKEQNITKIDFLKIDCEGYDGKILLGGSEIIKTCRWIQLEDFTHVVENDEYHDEAIKLIENLGYHIYGMNHSEMHVVYSPYLRNHLKCCTYYNYLLTREPFIIKNVLFDDYLKKYEKYR